MRVSVSVPFPATARGLVAVFAFLAILALSLSGPPAWAAEPADAPNAAPNAATQEIEGGAQPPAAAPRGLWARALVYVRTQQRELHRELAGAIKAVRREGSAAAAWSLIVLSFLYGVFHAAGPGHGKMVISSYLLTHKSAVRRGLWLSAVASLTQGLTAIVLVLVLVALVGWTRSDAQAAVGTLETVSFALIALLGLGLAARALWWLARGLLAAHRAPTAPASDGPSSDAHHEAGCGHCHTPDAGQLAQPLSLKTFAAVVLSVGIRPCSGAVLVLIFAEVLGLRWAGISAVLAMSLGTAATVGMLAVLAVNFRHLASLAAGGGRRFVLAGQAVALLGGGVITAIGASLFFGSLGAPHPLL